LAGKYKGEAIPAVKITANRVSINVTKETEEEYVKRVERSCYRVVELPWTFKVQK
jgi:HSP20 family molecular chaperone IbpA